MKISKRGIALVKEFEGLVDGDKSTPRLDPYLCPTGYATVGYGHVVLDPVSGAMLRGKGGLAKAKQVHPTGISVAEAEALLAEDMVSYGADVLRLCKCKPSQSEFDALTSLAFNIGVGALGRSTVLRLHNAGDRAGAARAFGMWTKGTVDGKKVALPGLVRRRAAEAALYLADAPAEAVVADWLVEEKPLARSREIAAAATNGGAGLAAAASLATVASELKEVRGDIAGLPSAWAEPVAIMLGLVIAAASIAAVVVRLRARAAGER